MSPTNDNSGIFVVVPAYNESEAIRPVVRELLTIYPRVVVVDDGSSDDTVDSVSGLGAQILCHLVNRGQGAALQTGIEFSLRHGAEVIVTFDSDGQHKVADIASLVAAVRSGDCDVALGSRFLGHSEGMPLTRRWLLKLGVLFTRLVSRMRVSDVHNGLRAFSRRAASELHITMDRMAHASEILDQIHARRWKFKEVPVTIRYTKYSLEKGQRSSNAVRIAFQILVEKLRQ